MSFKIVSTVERELTEGELASVKRFRSYTDGVSFACLSEDVMLMVDSAEVPRQNDPEALVSAAHRLMKETLFAPPDFEVFTMPDGHVMVMLNTGVVCFTSAPVSEEKNTMALKVLLRNACLQACEEGEVIAVAFEE